MKQYISIVVVCMLIILLMPTSTVVADDEIQYLSDLSDEQCIDFLKSSGVEIPPIYEYEMTWIVFIRTTIERVEENPNVCFSFGCTFLLQFANDIQAAVNSYYGISTHAPGVGARTGTGLIDNELYGDWLDKYSTYNCYGYAINQEEMCNPGVFGWVALENDASTYYYNDAANILTIATLVKYDLESLGYVVDSTTTTIPSNLSHYHSELICVRKDEDGILLGYDYLGNEVYLYDYHFMKYTAGVGWTHKPGRTHPLLYKYIPSSENDWVSESYNAETGVFTRDESFTYDSDIYFIKYTTPCEWIYEQHSTGMHVKRCTICGTARVLDCEWSDYVYTGENTHQANCVHCGVVSTADVCTREYVHSYDDTLGDVHEEICTVCNHVYTAQESCEFAYTDNEDGTHVAQCADCDVQYVLDCDYVCSYSGDGSTHTHTTTCSGCDHSETESCTFAIRYNGYVDGHNTHINACTECGYSKYGAVQCAYNSSGKCRFCGTMENFVPINREKEELLEA